MKRKSDDEQFYFDQLKAEMAEPIVHAFFNRFRQSSDSMNDCLITTIKALVIAKNEMRKDYMSRLNNLGSRVCRGESK